MNFNDSQKKINSSVWKWCELFCFYLLMPCLIVLDVIALKYRWILFVLTSLYVMPMIIVIKPALPDLGISKNQIWFVLKTAFLYAFGVGLTLTSLNYFEVFAEKLLIVYLIVFILYPLVSAPIQELFFRSYFFYRYKNLLNQQFLVLLNILLFAFYHKIYGGWLAVLLSLIGGGVLTLIYSRYKNYWTVCLAHGILGVLIYASGFGEYFTDLL